MIENQIIVRIVGKSAENIVQGFGGSFPLEVRKVVAEYLALDEKDIDVSLVPVLK